MMSLGPLNAAVALPLSLPAQLQQSLQGTPLEAALALAGVKVRSYTCSCLPACLPGQPARAASPAAPDPSRLPLCCRRWRTR
jgi:hypothetical protein